jgi:hypothetical protein
MILNDVISFNQLFNRCYLFTWIINNFFSLSKKTLSILFQIFRLKIAIPVSYGKMKYHCLQNRWWRLCRGIISCNLLGRCELKNRKYVPLVIDIHERNGTSNIIFKSSCPYVYDESSLVKSFNHSMWTSVALLSSILIYLVLLLQALQCLNATNFLRSYAFFLNCS